MQRHGERFRLRLRRRLANSGLGSMRAHAQEREQEAEAEAEERRQLGHESSEMALRCRAAATGAAPNRTECWFLNEDGVRVEVDSKSHSC